MNVKAFVSHGAEVPYEVDSEDDDEEDFEDFPPEDEPVTSPPTEDRGSGQSETL